MRRLHILGLRFLISLLILPLLPLFVPLLTSAAEVNDPWTQDVPLLQKTANHTSLSDGVFLFTFAGATNDDFSTVGRLDTSLPDISRSWVNISNIPENSYYHASVINHNYAYVLGGTQYPPQTSKSFVFVGTLGATGELSNWRALNPLPQRLSMGAAAVSGDYIYFSGGWTDSPWNVASTSNKVYFAPINNDGSLGSWTATTDLPYVLAAHGMVGYGQYVYVIGGWGGGSETSQVWRAQVNSNGSLGSWTAMPSLPGKSRNAGVTIAGNYVFVAGGHDGSQLLNTVYYTSIDNAGQMAGWQTSTNSLVFNGLAYKLCCGALSEVGGYLYLTGGYADGPGYTDKVYKSKLNIALPTPTPTPAVTPVVVVPGMGASWNYEALVHGASVSDTDWKIAPFVTLYGGIINALGSRALVYPYDWRRNITDTANNLSNFIDTQVLSGQVDLVGHSMGGLVARAYTQAHPERVRNLVTVGSPHKGAVSVYRIWEGADFSDMPGWMSLASRLLLRINRGSYANEVAEVQALFPSLRNIWPIFEFTDRPLTWNNNFLPGLDVPTQLKTIYGAGVNTPERITLINRSGTDALLNKWIDGKPTATQMGSGDNAVLITSGQVSGSADSAQLDNLTHDQIIGMAAGQDKILQMLGISATTADTAQKDLSQAVVVTVASPVNFSVIDPLGNSYSPTDGLVVIDDPANGNYQVQVSASGEGGNYDVYFGKIKNGDTAWETKSGSLGSGQSATYTFGAQMGQPNLGTAPLTLAQQRLNNQLTLVNSSSLSTRNKNVLKQDLARIKSYVTEIGQPRVNTAAKFDVLLSRLLRTIDALITRRNSSEWTALKQDLRLVKADLEQERGDRFAN